MLRQINKGTWVHIYLPPSSPLLCIFHFFVLVYSCCCWGLVKPSETCMIIRPHRNRVTPHWLRKGGIQYIHLDFRLPRKPHYPPCILPGSVCWSVNATGFTPAVSWSSRHGRRMEKGEGEQRRKMSLSFSVFFKRKDWCWQSTFKHLLWVKFLWLFRVL